MISTSNRYSDADLAEFKAAINKELDKAEKQLATLEEQLENATESNDDQGDYVDTSANQADLDMLQTMANRKRNYMVDLENALQRIHNKSYGICIITGELIDKRRLLAVPTTARCLAAKVTPPVEKKPFKPVATPKAGQPNKIISRVISPAKPKVVTPVADWDLEDEDEDDDYDEGMVIEDDFDFDSIVDEDSED